MVTYSKVGSWDGGGGGEEGEKCKPSMPPCYISSVKPLPWQPEEENWLIFTFIIWLVKS